MKKVFLKFIGFTKIRPLNRITVTAGQIAQFLHVSLFNHSLAKSLMVLCKTHTYYTNFDISMKGWCCDRNRECSRFKIVEYFPRRIL